MSEEQIKAQNKIREVIMYSFQKSYMELVQLVNKLESLNPILKSHAFLNLDQGAYWIREAIASMPLNFPEEPADQAQEAVQPEGSAAPEEPETEEQKSSEVKQTEEPLKK